MTDMLIINPPLVSSILSNTNKELSEVELLIEDNLISSINVGLLSISSYLVYKGYTVKILDLSRDDNYSQIEKVYVIIEINHGSVY